MKCVRLMVIGFLLVFGVVSVCYAGEVFTDLRVVLVQMQCECGGEMVKEEGGVVGEDGKHPHVCKKCGKREMFDVVYPRVKYVVDGVEDKVKVE